MGLDPQGKENLWGHILSHCIVYGISGYSQFYGYSQPYSVGGSSDAAAC